VEQGIPWQRASDLTSDIRFWGARAIGLLGIALLLLGLVTPLTWRHWPRRAGLIAVALGSAWALAFFWM
jgi:hypothetical protein